MTIFMTIHKWKKEDLKTVAKKVIEAMGQTLEGAKMISSHLRADQCGAWCVCGKPNQQSKCMISWQNGFLKWKQK
jgi:hypothetical protein